MWEYNDFTASLNFRFLDDNKDDCWLSTYYGLNDARSNPNEAIVSGDYGYNQMEVEYHTDLQVDYRYSDSINLFIELETVFGEELQ